jgi:hypothetical protein
MMKRFLSLMFCISVFAFASAYAGEKFFVQTPAPYAENGNVWGNIKNDCNVADYVSNQIFSKVHDKYPDSVQAKDIAEAGEGKFLGLTVLNARGAGGGNWSGAKSLTVRAELYQNGKVIRSVVAQRSSRGGVFGGITGTCPIIERDAGAIGKDLVRWLEKSAPVEGSSAASDAEQ